MGYFLDLIKRTTESLLPTGRSFTIPVNGVLDKFKDAVVESEARLMSDIFGVYDSVFPDNPNFTSDDATRWERTLGLITNTNVDIEDRKLGIVRKLNYPGIIKPRENYRSIQKSLRAAGFDVYVYENRFPDGMGGWVTKTPQEVSLSVIDDVVQHGQYNHGQIQHGQSYTYKIVNSVDASIDASFDEGDNLRSTFFISGDILGLNAIIPAEREIEFRKLVLALKPVQTVAYAFIDSFDLEAYFSLNEDGGSVLNEDGGYVLDEKE